MTTKSLRACVLMFLVIAGVSCRDVPDTPLSAAAAAGRVAEVETLLADGADPNGTDGNDLTPLAWAARHGRIQTIAVLLEHGADPDLAAERPDWVPLVHAVHSGQNLAVAELVAGGANIRGPGGQRALRMAAGYGNAVAVREMLAHGADPRIPGLLDEAVGGAWDIDYTWPGCESQTDTVRALLEVAPDLKVGEDFLNRRALSKAKKRGCTELVEMIGPPDPGDHAANRD